MSQTTQEQPGVAFHDDLDDARIDPPAVVAPRTTVVREAPKASVQPTQEPAMSFRHSETFGKFATALAAAQGEFQEVEKNLTAKVDSKRTGVKYEYGYADLATILAAIRPALSKHNLALMQFPTVRPKGVLVTTFLVHGESAEWFAGDLGVSLDSTAPQAVGEATTYARRYGVTALVAIAAGERDTDANEHRQAQPPPEAPEGYDAWLLDMESVADEGMSALEAAWEKSRMDYKVYLKNTAAKTWASIKAKAGKVKR